MLCDIEVQDTPTVVTDDEKAIERAEGDRRNSEEVHRGSRFTVITMWRAWIGFNFSHSLGVLLFAALAVWTGSRINTLPVGIMPALTLIGCVYLVLALRYWFRTPAIGIAIGTGCFAAAWVLSLR